MTDQHLDATPEPATPPVPLHLGKATKSQFARYGELLHRRAYAAPEGLDDDRPRHFDGAPTWVDVLGRR